MSDQISTTIGCNLDGRPHDPRTRLHASRGAGRHPPEGGGGAATIPLRRAPSCIHGPRTSGHGGRAIDRLDVVPDRVVHPGLLGGWVVSKPPSPRRTPDEVAR